MERVDTLAGVLAVLRAPARCGLSASERIASLTREGLEATLARTHGDLFGPAAAVAAAHEEVSVWAEDMQVRCILDEDYPQVLSTSCLAPGLVFTQGDLVTSDLGVSIVGSRAATIDEEKIAASIARRTCEMGLSVLSGLAHGIDAAAHRAALDVGGRTVAVMATPLERTYPADHQGLRERIAASGGLVLSQFTPGTPTGPHSFPMRNATMSAYSIATVIVAAQETSGTRHQAHACLDHDRPLILLPQVAQHTTWGKEMTTRAGVHIAHDLDELTSILEPIRHKWHAHDTQDHLTPTAPARL